MAEHHDMTQTNELAAAPESAGAHYDWAAVVMMLTQPPTKRAAGRLSHLMR